jgi:uncharacterized protein YndB with AHSA1/START domain
MSTQAQATTVRREIVVEASAERAFRVFTERLDEIKPRDHNPLEVEIAETVLEPRAGGRIYDRGVDGSEFEWATLLAFEPPLRFAFSWNFDASWEFQPDAARRSEVEISFHPEGAGRTRVVLEHRHLERHGEGWEGMREGVGGEGGWPLYLDRFAAVIQAGGAGGTPRPQP